MASSITDFWVQTTGSNFVVLHPMTPDGERWIADHIDGDATHWCGGVVVEHRYFEDIIHGILNDGLSIQ